MLMKDKNGNLKLFIQAPQAEKHLLLCDDIERALFRGDLDDKDIKWICWNWLNGRSESYAKSAVRYCLKHLMDHGYELPPKLAKEMHQ